MTEYWSCGLNAPGHQHPTEEMAEKCLVKRTKHSVHAENCAVIKARFNQIIELYLVGMNFSQIGREVGVSGGTIREHVRHAMGIATERVNDRLGRLPDGTYTNQLMDFQYITRCLNEKQLNALILKWDSMLPNKPLRDWWEFLAESNARWAHRDGKGLNELTAKERKDIRPVLSRKDWLEQIWAAKKNPRKRE